MRKIMGPRSSLSITTKVTSTIVCNPLPEYVGGGGVTHDCASIYPG